jgi:hypothetical protein
MRRLLTSLLILAAIVTSAMAQAPGSFRGRIVDADTGQTVSEEGVTIVLTKEGASAASRRVVDVKGAFVVPDLSPGRYQIQFRYKGIQTGTARYVQVTGVAPATPADIYLRLPGEVSGVVVDKDGQPVQGSEVMLVTIEYFAGQAIHTVFTGRQTDDRGNFNLSTRVEAGRPYFLLVLPPEGNTPTLSGTLSLEPLWYPGRPGLAQPFVIRSAERKRLDFVLEKGKTYCLDGRLTSNGQPAALGFEIAIPEVAGYRGGTGGTQGVISRGQSDASGHFQACGLLPGDYLLAAGMNKTGGGGTQTLYVADSYGRTNVSIVDRDVHDVKLNAQSAVALAAEIRLDRGEFPPPEAYRLQFMPLSRVAFESQPFLLQAMDVAVPSRFSVSLLPSTDYRVNLGRFDGTSDWYLKDVTCGGTTRRNSLKLDETDCGLRITVGTDMGKLAALVLDKDNKNDLNSSVCVASSSSLTREEVALTGACASTDPGATSSSVSMPLRPDRYLAVVVPAGTLDWVEYFLTNRGEGTPIDIKASATVQVTLKHRDAR